MWMVGPGMPAPVSRTRLGRAISRPTVARDRMPARPILGGPGGADFIAIGGIAAPLRATVRLAHLGS
jgi:hypothetical protein